MTDLKSTGASLPPNYQPGIQARRAPGQTGPLTSVSFPDMATPNLATPGFDPSRAAVDNVRVAANGSSLMALNWLDQAQPDSFGTMSAHFRVRDIDGLDQKSKADLRGQLDAEVKLGRNLLDYSVAQANQKQDDFKFEISYENGSYKIPVAYRAPVLGNIWLGSVTITPEGGELKVKIGGVTGGLAKFANFVSFGAVKSALDSLIADMTKNMGFKVSSAGVTEYSLAPDLQNSPLFKEFPLAGGEKLKIESINAGSGSVVNLGTDANGDLRISMKNLDVVASTGPGGPQASPDAEGPDQMDLKAQGRLNRDLSSDVSTELDLSLDVRDHEKAGLQQRIKALTGQDLPVSGKVSIQDLKVQSHIESNGQVSQLSTEGGKVSAEQLNLELGPTKANFSQISGDFKLQRNGGQTSLGATDLSLTGKFSSSQGALDVKKLELSGTLRHDQAKPNDIRFDLNPGSKLEFSGNLSQGGQSVGVQNLSLQNASLTAQLDKGSLRLVGANGQTPQASLQRLTLPGTDLRNIQLSGSLSADSATGSLALDAKKFSLGGTVNGIRLDTLSGSGKVAAGANGLKLSDATFNAKGKAGDFGFSRLSGSGSLSVGSDGSVKLEQVNNLVLNSSMGLNLNGSFKGSLVGQRVDLESTGKTPAKFDYAPKGGDIALTGLSLSGAKISADLASGSLSLASRQGQTVNAGAKSIKLQDIAIKDLKLSGGQLQANAGTGSLNLGSDARHTLKVTAASLDLPGLNMTGLSIKGGELAADTQGGRVSLRSPADKPLDASAATLTLPGVNLKDLRLKGGLEADTRTGVVDIDAKDFSLAGKIGDLGIEKLSGAGKAQIKPDGTIKLDDVRGLEMRTDIGLALKGDFKGVIHGNNIHAETPAGGSAGLDYKAPDGSLALTGVQLQGKVDGDLGKQVLDFATIPGGSLKLAQGEVGGVTLKDLALSDGSLHYKPGELSVMPLPGATLKASGELEGVKIASLETSGPVVYDFNAQEVKWDQPVKASLPAHGVSEVKTNGPVSLKALPSGEIVFNSHGGTLDATIGQLKLENLKTDGRVIYNPGNGQLRFEGFDGKPLSVEGSFNGKPLKLASSGQIQIEDKGETYKISGQQIKVSGLVDGFTLDSPAGAAATVSVARDFSNFALEDLNFGFKLDDVSVQNGGGSVRSTPEGLEISLNGALGGDKGHLRNLLTKLGSRQDFGATFPQTMQQVNGALDKAFAEFENASLNFENLTLKLNKDASLRSFTVDNNSQLHKARMEVDLYGKKKTLPMGDVSWTAKVQGDSQRVEVPEGRVSFNLNEDLRKMLAEEIKQQLEDSGLKKVKLEIEPSGKVKILNATVDGKLIDLSAKLELSTRISGTTFEVGLDKVALKNFLLNIIGKLANAPDKVADQVDSMLAQQKIKYERRNSKGTPDPESGRVFALDLQALLKRIDPNVTLKSASLDPQGKIQIDYSYSAALNQ